MAIAAELGRGRPRFAVRSGKALFIGGAVLVEVAFGLAIAADHGLLALGALLAAASAAAIVRFPFLATCALLFLVAGFLTDELPMIGLGGFAVHPAELLTGALLALAVVRPRRHWWGGLPGLLLALFLGVLVLTSLVAWQSGDGPLTEILLSGRSYFLLTFFWIVVRLFPGRREALRLLTTAAAIGAVTGAIALLLALKVDPSTLLLSPSSTVLYDQDSGSLLRVRLPGLALAFAVLPLVIFFVARGRKPLWVWSACLAGILVNILVSFNRNMWVAGTVGLVLVVVLMGPRVRGRIVAAAVIICSAVVVLAALPPTTTPTTTVLRPVITRGKTLFAPSKVQAESSLEDRGRENRAAWKAASDNLLLGVAPGVPWGLYTRDFDGTKTVVEPQSFVHNQYLYLLLITGVPGALLLVGFLFVTTAAGLRDPRGRPEATMLGVGLLTMMLTAIVMLSLSDGNYLLAVALLAGCIPALTGEAGA